VHKVIIRRELMSYKIYLASSAIFFLLMVASGIGALLTGSANLVLLVVGCFILAMISVQMAKKAAKKEVEKRIKDVMSKRQDR
jgi:hypothetical protein